MDLPEAGASRTPVLACHSCPTRIAFVEGIDADRPASQRPPRCACTSRERSDDRIDAMLLEEAWHLVGRFVARPGFSLEKIDLALVVNDAKSRGVVVESRCDYVEFSRLDPVLVTQHGPQILLCRLRYPAAL